MGKRADVQDPEGELGRYIIRPKTTTGYRYGSTTSAVSVQNRKLRIEFLRGRTPDKTEQFIRNLVPAKEPAMISGGRTGKNPNRAPTSEDSYLELSATRIMILHHDQARNLGNDHPELLIIPDAPINLIQPVIQTEPKAEISEADLWHLEVIGLMTNGRRTCDRRGAGITIAVLDTGIEGNHQQLEGRVAKSFSFHPTSRTEQEEADHKDTHGHGTHVAGLIAGKETGVAPDATLINIIMLPDSKGWISEFVVAMELVRGLPDIFVANISAGIPGFVPELQLSVQELIEDLIIPVIAIGNDGRNQSRSPGNHISAISVGAANKEGKISNFSGGGSMVENSQKWVVPSMVAPGEDVCSADRAGGYRHLSGTSMAAPIVSGLVALMIEKDPSSTLHDIREGLIEKCNNLGFTPDRQGAGLVQVPL